MKNTERAKRAKKARQMAAKPATNYKADIKHAYAEGFAAGLNKAMAEVQKLIGSGTRGKKVTKQASMGTKKRGRPRKNTVEVIDAPKKRRGRPPKNKAE